MLRAIKMSWKTFGIIKNRQVKKKWNQQTSRPEKSSCHCFGRGIVKRNNRFALNIIIRIEKVLFICFLSLFIRMQSIPIKKPSNAIKQCKCGRYLFATRQRRYHSFSSIFPVATQSVCWLVYIQRVCIARGNLRT